MNNTLYKKIKKLNFNPQHVAEVGVHFPETSNILLFIENGCRADLFEPDPLCIAKIMERFKGYKNVNIHPYAIYDKATTLELYRVGSSSFVKNLKTSPAIINDKYLTNNDDLFYAEARLFKDFDDGTIDLLSVDTEGCEWYVIKYMISRPAIISLETHSKRYKNPYLKEIQNWMKDNGYKIWYKDQSDTVYIKKIFKPDILSHWYWPQYWKHLIKVLKYKIIDLFMLKSISIIF